MSCGLSKELREKHNVRSVPVRKGDTVEVVVGSNKGTVGKVIQVYRRKYIIHIEGVTTDKKNETPVQVGIHPSNCKITALEMTYDSRKKFLARKGGNDDGAESDQSAD